MNRKPGPMRISILIVAGILISYIQQMGPSPLLYILRDEFNLQNNEALLNLCVSIIFPFLVLGGFFGSYIERRAGIKHLYSFTLAFLSVGLIGNFWATSAVVFLICRSVYGFGFGLGVPFIGSAIMKWYDPRRREFMTSLNALFPFIATLISFCLMLPLTRLLAGSWRAALGIWGFLTLAILVIWNISEPASSQTIESGENTAVQEPALYRNLIRRKPIRCLTLIFMCDFFCYSFIATILPTWLYELGDLTEAASSVYAAIAFPLIGFLGCLCGGLYTTKKRRLNPPLRFGQVLKLAGLCIAAVSADFRITVIGVALFSFGNGVWMPSMYGIPTKLEDMSPIRVGASYTLMSACGFICGFISPVIGGWLTDIISSGRVAAGNALHIIGLRTSVFVFGLLNLIAFIYSMRITEVGRRNSQ